MGAGVVLGNAGLARGCVPWVGAPRIVVLLRGLFLREGSENEAPSLPFRVLLLALGLLLLAMKL